MGREPREEQGDELMESYRLARKKVAESCVLVVTVQRDSVIFLKLSSCGCGEACANREDHLKSGTSALP